MQGLVCGGGGCHRTNVEPKVLKIPHPLSEHYWTPDFYKP